MAVSLQNVASEFSEKGHSSERRRIIVKASPGKIVAVFQHLKNY
jgi:hypothetical protein